MQPYDPYNANKPANYNPAEQAPAGWQPQQTPGYSDPVGGYPNAGYPNAGYPNPGYPNAGSPNGGYPNPGYQNNASFPPPPGFTGQQYPGYPAQNGGYGGGPFDQAPFGRDPLTGEPLSDKSKVTAALLQFFLGGFGVGRFYLGHNGTAIAQLVLTIVGWITAIFLIGFLLIFAVGIWAIVDVVMILTGSLKDSRGLKLRS